MAEHSTAAIKLSIVWTVPYERSINYPSLSQPPPPASPPRAFTQGVGTVFQFAGVILFIVSMFVCCASSLLSRETAMHTGLTTIGWHSYSAQKAITISLLASIFFGLVLAGFGLG